MAAAAAPLPPPPNRAPLGDLRVADVTTLAGTGARGDSDGAQFNHPAGLAVAPSGILYLTDTLNHRIRQIDPATGAVTTLAGSVAGFADGVGVAARFHGPSGLFVAPSGIVYVADTENHRIRQIDPVTGAVTTLAGSVEGFAEGVGGAAQFNNPYAVAVAPSGIVYVADSGNHRIRQLDPATGAVATLAGSVEGFADGVGVAAQFDMPLGLAIAPSGMVYVADTYNHRIRQIDLATGAVTTVAGSVRGFAEGVGVAAQFHLPMGLAVAPSGVVYIADTYNHRIRQLNPRTEAVTTVAGSVRGFAEGDGEAAQFDLPMGLAVAPPGIVYVADTMNQRIRKFTPRANPGLIYMAREAIAKNKSKFAELPQHIVGDIFSYVGNTRGPGGGIHPRIASSAEAARHEKAMSEMAAAAAGATPVAAMNALNRRSTRSRRTRKHRSRTTRRTSRR